MMRLYFEHKTECWWSLIDTPYDEYWIAWITPLDDLNNRPYIINGKRCSFGLIARLYRKQAYWYQKLVIKNGSKNQHSIQSTPKGSILVEAGHDGLKQEIRLGRSTSYVAQKGGPTRTHKPQ